MCPCRPHQTTQIAAATPRLSLPPSSFMGSWTIPVRAVPKNVTEQIKWKLAEDGSLARVTKWRVTADDSMASEGTTSRNDGIDRGALSGIGLPTIQKYVRTVAIAKTGSKGVGLGKVALWSLERWHSVLLLQPAVHTRRSSISRSPHCSLAAHLSTNSGFTSGSEGSVSENGRSGTQSSGSRVSYTHSRAHCSCVSSGRKTCAVRFSIVGWAIPSLAASTASRTSTTTASMAART